MLEHSHDDLGKFLSLSFFLFYYSLFIYFLLFQDDTMMILSIHHTSMWLAGMCMESQGHWFLEVRKRNAKWFWRFLKSQRWLILHAMLRIRLRILRRFLYGHHLDQPRDPHSNGRETLKVQAEADRKSAYMNLYVRQYYCMQVNRVNSQSVIDMAAKSSAEFLISLQSIFQFYIHFSHTLHAYSKKQ